MLKINRLEDKIIMYEDTQRVLQENKEKLC